ncbi:S8 family serine peptidase [Aquabacterium sp. OR-4]|uniref:S8 family serine peptidase n=1 Tax=Aquabacterium sp. OR-4 TaxID=2978127 RepID=UPI0021B47ACC|nr:S8 family serine peptidase [Aquabacterium sp. OR-4]MDT7835535.1 S8 family serine peptidase [Aquabacterium sp. OR-4]
MSAPHPIQAIGRLAAVALACTLIVAAPGAWAQAAAKPRIDKAADMPRFSYPVQGSLEDLLRSSERFAPLAAALRRDAEAVLTGYDIADRATQRDLLARLATLDYLDGRYDAAVGRAEQMRALQDKPADKLLSGLRLRAMATAAKTHARGSDAWRQAVVAQMARELAAMPFAVIENDIKGAKASAELMGEGLVLGGIRERLQPMADSAGALSSEFAPALAGARLTLLDVLPLKADLVTVYGELLARHQVLKPDIWAARDFSLPVDGAAGAHRPVTLAVWDSGVDTALFKDQVQRDAAGQPALIAFDKYAQPVQGELMPIPEALRSRLPQMLATTKGLSDLQSGIDSAEASQVKQQLSRLAPADYKATIEELGLAGNYEHGTHVAGIALAGNPHARLVVARIEFGHTLRPDPCPSLELARRDAANYPATVAFFQRQGVRVVNMSWGGSVGDVERELEQCGIGATPEARKAQARELFDILKQALTRAMAAAPQILFVAAAGNSNRDSSFDEASPADIVLPNLLTVGAVDRAGDEAPFTSYGPTVKVHANGYQVESYLPGGARVALSGTSMAAPQVANLAAKLLAVKPALTPPQLIQAITGTVDRSADGRRLLMNPKAALAAVQAGR